MRLSGAVRLHAPWRRQRSPTRPLAAPVHRRVSLFRCDAALSGNAICVPQRLSLHFTAGGTAPGAAGGCTLRGLSVLSAARHQVDCPGLGRRVLLCACSLRGGGSEMQKRLLGLTDTPCGHFTPDAAPPLSLTRK